MIDGDPPQVERPAPDSNDVAQESLFGPEEEAWKEHWTAMPEYDHKNLRPFHSIYVHFESRADMDAFSKVVGQRITPATRFIWHPEAEIGRYADKRWLAISLDPIPERPDNPDDAL